MKTQVEATEFQKEDRCIQCENSGSTSASGYDVL